MSKYDALGEIAKKISVLDNEVKLKILALLIEEGSKSITDIARDLNLNFSTAHKYLEQLEASGLVASKQVSENRLKRLFTIKDFDIELSPKGISQILSGSKETKGTKKGLKVLNENGALVDFDDKLFAQKYLKRGMPQGTIVSTLNAALEQAYDSITLLELRRLFKEELKKKTENVRSVFEQIEDSDKHKRTYEHIMEVFHPEALNMHAGGDIFIKNLYSPNLSNFIHDIRSIAIHGTNGKKPTNLQEFFKQILFAIDFVSTFVTGKQAFDSFNYFIAPLAKNLNDYELRKLLKEFFDNLSKLNINFFIALEIGFPDYLKTLPVGYFIEKEIDSYATYQAIATKITKLALELQNNYKNLYFIIKIWDKKNLEKNWPAGVYIANMTTSWQQPNAGFADFNARLNPEFRKVVGTNRAGELQEIVINMPRLAINSTSFKEFLYMVEQTIWKCCDFIENMAELSHGEFVRKHKTLLKSIQTKTWAYVISERCSYAISLTGLKNAVNILETKTGEKNLLEKILKKCDEIIYERIKIPIRVLLKENLDPYVAKRFHHLDSKFKPNLPQYMPGLELDLSELYLQRYLWGGCCKTLDKNQLKNLKKLDFGVVKLI